MYDSLFQQELPLGGDIFVLVKVFWLKAALPACLSRPVHGSSLYILFCSMCLSVSISV